jgi:hypothetical protein
MKSIRWDRESDRFILSDGTSSIGRESFAVDSGLDVSLSSLRRALARQSGVSVPPLMSLPYPKLYENDKQFDESIISGPGGEIVFEGKEEESNMLFFLLTKQGHLRAHFAVENPRVLDKDLVVEVTKRMFGKLCILIERLRYLTDPWDGTSWSFEMACDPRDRTVGSVWRAYKSLAFMLTTLPEDLANSGEGVQLALRLGRPHVLIGAPESSWLEVKSHDYLLSSATEKVKLALDVARFANADGGLLVLGLRTVRSNGIDIISQVTPLPMPARSVARYRSIIDTHVYPLVRGLEVFSAPYGQGELLTISIPPQRHDDKPFVVQGNLGSITDNKLKGLFVSIVQRRGEGAEYLSGPAVYGLIANRRMRQAE